MLAGVGELAGDGAIERLDEEGRLAAARDAGHRGEQAKRNVDGDVLEVVGARAVDREPAAAGGLPPLLRHRDLLEAGEILPGEAVGVGHHLARACLRATTSPPWTPAPGPMSTTWSAVRIASSSCSTTSDAVADVAERFERLEQPRIVALMQADGRLVEHIEHAGEARADLRGETDALALAARQRSGRRGRE